MSRLWVAPIVEGRGEVASVRILLERFWYELLGGEFIQVIQPIREKRGKLVHEESLKIAVRSASLKLARLAASDDPKMVLILMDADEDCPKKLALDLLSWARGVDSRVDVACVLANVEYETWFVAASESLSEYLDLTSFAGASESPEDARHKKAWIERRYLVSDEGSRYSPVQDQPAMTRAMDLTPCRRPAPSFDKLCRDLEQRLRSRAEDV